MSPRLRIAIATLGRFHVLDLARELARLGHEVRFHSGLPRARALAFGLPAECHVPPSPALLPLLAWQRLAPRRGPDRRDALTWRALDRHVAARLEPCDVFVGMSGIVLDAARHARARFGAKVVVVRGSKHILAQDEILARLPGADRPSPLAIARELEGYRLADAIDVPSTHVRDSFARDPTLAGKLIQNPYGVDLDLFSPGARGPATRPPTLLFAGTWSKRKGCDLLLRALDATPGLRLQHAGPVGDLPFPAGHPRMATLGALDQRRLPEVMRAADALVLPSREEGLALVLPQALACGLPILCSADTGGADLRHTPALADRIAVGPTGDAGALAQDLARLRDRLVSGPAFAPLGPSDREALSWGAYARRYEANLLRLLGRAPA